MRGCPSGQPATTGVGRAFPEKTTILVRAVVLLLSADSKRNTSRSSQLPGDSLTAIFFDHGADHGGIAGIVFQANRHFPL